MYAKNIVADVKLYIVAQKYGCQDLQELVIVRLVKFNAYPPQGASLSEAVKLAFQAGDGPQDNLANVVGGVFCASLKRTTAEIASLTRERRPVPKNWQTPYLDCISHHPELAASLEPKLKNGLDLEALVLYRCHGCGKISSDDPGECDDCEQDAVPEAFFRVKTESH